MIAQMLQMQFDKEYDEMLTKTEQKFNGASKVSISFENYRRTPQNFGKNYSYFLLAHLFSEHSSFISLF